MGSFSENIVSRLSEVFPNIPEFLINNFLEEVNNDENECTSKCIEYLEQRESAPTVLEKVPTLRKPFPHHIQPCTMSFHFNIEQLLDTIRSGSKVLVLMRGVPGCGKSYLAKEILKYTVPDSSNPKDHIFSADDFFYDARGRYMYDRNLIPMAHEDTQKKVNNQAMKGWSPLIVDNTNVKLWEMMPYVVSAVKNGYYVEIVQPMTPWCKSPGKLAQKNSHGVPKDRISSMLDSFEHGTSRDLLSMLRETTYSDPPPQQRTHPPIPELSTGVVPQTSTPSPSYPEDTKKPKITESPIRPSTSQNEGNAWLPYEQESSTFWKNNDFPKPVRVKKKTNGSLLDCLKNDKPAELPTPEAPPEAKKLAKHTPGCTNENQTFVLLKQIYPNQSAEHLWDLFEKCNGDLDWTVDLLLNDNTPVEHLVNSSGFQCMCNVKSSDIPMIPESTFVTNVEVKLVDVKPQRVKKDVSGLKKTIESQFVLGEEFYSDKLKKIKNRRYGIEEPPVEDKDDDRAIPVDFNYNDLPDFDNESNSNETESNEMVEMDLGSNLVAQLTQMFETEDISLSQGATQQLNSNVFMPKSLAKQLYVIWMESLYNQMEEMKQKSLREDEEFARILELPKYANRKAVPSNYSEIMDMELAWQLYYAENNSKLFKDNTPKDLADHLTRMKLCELFPKVDKKTLVEVLMAHNNSFTETVEVLKLSTNINGLDEKMKITKDDLLDKVKNEKERMRNTVPASPMKKIIVKDERQNAADEVQRQALKVFEENRNMASHHSQMRAECFQKAREAHQKCNPGVALYYSQIASLHKSKSEEFNHKAANSIMEVHDIRQNNPDYIDLHYLHTVEAAQCLDIFLDRHISKLRNSTRSYKYVFIITGRGLHSAGGVSTIKMKVKQRLKERKLVSSEVNPGLLKVKIHSTSKYSRNV